MKIWIGPNFGEAPDTKGDGGIRRVVEAQRKWLPEYGDEIVEDIYDAEVVACHAMLLDKPVKREQLLVHHNHGLYWSEYEWEPWSYNANHDVIESMRRADIVTAVSEWTARIIRRGTLINPTVIGHGIDPEDYEPAKEHGQYVLWNKTRIDPVCDPEPVAELSKLAQDVEFVSTLMHSDIGPATNLHITGVLPYENARDFVRRAGVYMATTRETFGIGTLEAMAYGVPVLGWDWGGQAEFVEHGVTGWLSRPGDYDNLLEGLRYCLANRDKMGQAAREYVIREHCWRNVIGRYHDLYARHVGSPVRLSPRVSIVVTCHNLEQYLEECITSILAQRMQDWEVIVVDDCSPHDKSEETVAEVVSRVVGDDSRFHVLRTPTNLYLSGALNFGIERAQAKYVMPLDADNMLGQPEALGLLCDVLDTHRELDIVYGSMEWFEEDPDGTQRERGVSPWPPRDFSYRTMMRGGNQIPSTSMYRKKVWERVGGYRRRCRTQEDAEFWVRAVSYGARPAKIGDFVHLRYRDRLDSMSHTEDKWPYYAWTRKTWISQVDEVDLKEAAESVHTYEPSLISVVIPVGPGHEQYVIDAVDSVLAQTFQKWEIIVVNDTGAAITTWLPPFVKVVRTTKKGGTGPAKARNKGIKACSTPLFVLLDADDYLAPTFLEKTFAVFKQHGGYVYTDWIKAESGEKQEVEDFSVQRIMQGQYCAVTCLYPRKAWEDVGGFTENIKTWEDWDFFIKLIKRGYCGTHIPQALFYYRINSGTVREALYAQKPELIAEMHELHKDIFKEGKELDMGCGCGGGGYIPPYVEAPAGIQELEAMGDQDMVLLQYERHDGSTVTYLGPVTNTQYRFGDDEGHRVHWVHRKDAERFLLLDDFKLVKDESIQTEAGPRLVAAGPPVAV